MRHCETARHALTRLLRKSRQLSRLVENLDWSVGRPMVCLARGDDRGPTLWLLGWGEGHHTEVHDHDRSEVAVAVLQGRVFEDIFPYQGQTYRLRRKLDRGLVAELPAPYYHRVGNVHRERAVTLHAYYPKLSRMTLYREVGAALSLITTWED
jgi:predicted metal-dependent enzyme (double-stranded beta helix superfamily)